MMAIVGSIVMVEVTNIVCSNCGSKNVDIQQFEFVVNKMECRDCGNDDNMMFTKEA